MGTIVLILICVGLSIGLIWSQKWATEQKSEYVDRIGEYSNKLFNTTASLDQQRQVNVMYETDLKKEREAFGELTNNLARVSANLEKTEAALRTTQEEMTRQVSQRDTKIADLETQNQALDQRANELNASLTNLTAQIDDTRKRLEAAEGDKETLTKELQRLMTEKAELERKFNDIAFLRAQVAKVKEEMNIARRVDWLRKGLASDQKGAEQLIQKGPLSTNHPARQPVYDLNVEISADGTVRVIQPLTNKPSTTPPRQ